MTDWCSGCFLFKKHRVPFVGPLDARFAVVGEGPADSEIQKNEPFIGPSGGLLNLLLKHIGIDRRQIRIGNVLCCGKITDADRDNYTAFSDALYRCRMRREEEGDLGNAQTVLALGSVAAWGMAGRAITLGGRHPRRGAYFQDTRNRLIIPSWHPAAILRGGGIGEDGRPNAQPAGAGGLSDAEAETLGFDLEKAWNLSQGRVAPFKPSLTSTGDPREFVRLVERIRATTKVFSLDVEATDVNPLTCKLTVVGLSYTRADGVVEAVSLWWPNDDGSAHTALKDLIADPTMTLCAHNSQYDTTVLNRLIGPLHCKIEDTLLVNHAVFPDCKQDLGSVAHTHLVVPAWKADQYEYESKLPAVEKTRWNAERVRHLLAYNGMDVATTEAIRPKLRALAVARKVDHIADLDIRLAMAARRMTEWGVPVSQPIRAEMRTEFAAKVLESEASVERQVIECVESNLATGLRPEATEALIKLIAKRGSKFKKKVTPGWSPGSTDLIRLAFDAGGVELPAGALTDTGKRSVGKQALASVAEHPLVMALTNYRRSTKMLSLYFDSDDFKLDEDSRLHVAWKIHGTPTGRWSSGSGADRGSGDFGIALQNWPKAMRRMIVAPPGWILVGCDYSALELRVIALLAGEAWLIDAFMEKRDLHSENASRLYTKAWKVNDPLTTCDPQEQERRKRNRKLLRQLTKTGIYAAMYGAAALTIQSQLRAQSFKESDVEFARVLRGLTVEQCQAFVDAIPKLMPCIARFREQQIKRVVDEGRMLTAFEGRRRVWPLGRGDASQAVNGIVQGCLQGHTKVLTDNGYRAIKDLHDHPVSGAKVWTGTTWAAFDVVNRGTCQLAEITLDNGQRIDCDTRHKLLRMSNDGYTWTEFQDLRPGDQVAVSVPKPVEFTGTISNPVLHPTASAETHEKFWYWMGYYLGDGWLRHHTDGRHNTQHFIGYVFAEAERESLLKCESFWQSLGFDPKLNCQSHAHIDPKYRSIIRLTVYSVELVQKLTALGFTAATASTKRIPSVVFTLPLRLRKSFIKGLFGADGYSTPLTRNLHLCQRPLLEDTQLLLRSLGVRSRLNGPYMIADSSGKVFTSYRLNATVSDYRTLIEDGEPSKRVVEKCLMAPEFMLRQYRERFSSEPWGRKFWPSESAYVVHRRVCTGGKTSMGMLRYLVDHTGRTLDVPLYDYGVIEAIETLDREDDTYTLSVDDGGHRFDAEGVITKNSSADIMNDRFLKLLDILPSYAKVILQVHDSVTLEVPEQYAEETKKLLVDTMTTTVEYGGYSLRFDVEADVGPSWDKV